ncbi:MAG: response regulator [Xenococcaceae cyanobacterium]
MNRNQADASRGDILIVDDTPDNLRLLSRMLANKGYEVRKALNGQMALTSAQADPPDLILLDIKMPQMDGYEVCKYLKADAQTHEVPVIFLSALDTVLDKVKAFDLGGVDYITKPFQSEEVLARVENQLRLKRAEEELKRALEKEKELNELKSRFISMVSHDFRNPLTSINIAVKLLQDYGQTISEKEKLEYLELILSSSNSMLQLLEDLLVIGRADAGKLESNPTSVNLVSLCQLLVKQMRFSDEELHPIVFSYQGEKDFQVTVDRNALQSILTNLLSNALKYSPEGTEVKFELSVSTAEAVFRVQDRGIGIPPEDLPHLFESFHRAKNVGNVKGTGLGLAIAQRYAELLNTQISVNSKVGFGTTFTVTLPLNNWHGSK